MIDATIGNIKLGDVLISKAMNAENFLESNAVKYIYKKEQSIYLTVYLKNILYDNQTFIVVLYFNEQKVLKFVSMCIGSDTDKSWSDWSEERELDIKRKNDEWLSKQLGEPTRSENYPYPIDEYEYDWGTVSSSYDPRSASSSIWVNYII